MTTKKLAFSCLALIVAIPLLMGFKGGQNVVLDDGETAHLVFMRQEEKLAHDVYLTMGDKYPDEGTFANIVLSEQKHTDAMETMLAKFGVPDPVVDDSVVGEFTGPIYGPFFTATYATLVAQGNTNALNALYVGALIEELDMHDIINCPVIIVETDNGIGEGECGMEYTDERALIQSYGNLLEGSKDHLRAFVRSIELIIGEGNYVAQYLSQEEVDEILGR